MTTKQQSEEILTGLTNILSLLDEVDNGRPNRLFHMLKLCVNQAQADLGRRPADEPPYEPSPEDYVRQERQITKLKTELDVLKAVARPPSDHDSISLPLPTVIDIIMARVNDPVLPLDPALSVRLISDLRIAAQTNPNGHDVP